MDRERKPAENKPAEASSVKSGNEGVSEALQAIQRLAMEIDLQDLAPHNERICRSCGFGNREQNRFCSHCGVPLDDPQAQPAAESAPSTEIPIAPGEHHYHHHYHHHYFGAANGLSGLVESRTPSSTRDSTPTRAPLSGPALSRAESTLRKTTQDWALACNTKQLDDLVSLYVNDALVLRPNVPLVRGAAAIREFFFAALDSGLGEVELSAQRVELFGEMGYEAGRCKMLVPSALGKRREERGKYLILYNRQGQEWRIVVDCWSTDLTLGE